MSEMNKRILQELTLEPGFDSPWQMTTCERLALLGLLKRLQPKLSLEVGTYLGGSLQALARFSEKVISIDCDPEVPRRLVGRFNNVEFRCGDSRHLLPEVIEEINQSGRECGLVLIDGDHSGKSIRRDIESLLNLVPRNRVVVLLHDSFNPDCRAGMKSANWGSCPYVYQVELDFIPGIFHHEAHDKAKPRSMWGGFGCAVLGPEKRVGNLVIQESQRGLHEAVKRNSCHRFDGTRLLKRRLFRVLEKIAAIV
jgi:hypothetical protein